MNVLLNLQELFVHGRVIPGVNTPGMYPTEHNFENIHHADSNVRPSAYYHTLRHSKFIRVRFLSRPIPTNRLGELTPSPGAARTVMKNLRAIFHARKLHYATSHFPHKEKRLCWGLNTRTSCWEANDLRTNQHWLSSWCMGPTYKLPARGKAHDDLPAVIIHPLPQYLLVTRLQTAALPVLTKSSSVAGVASLLV